MTAIISALGLWFYPTVAMVIFMATFVVLMRRLYHPSRKRELHDAARIPLDD